MKGQTSPQKCWLNGPGSESDGQGLNLMLTIGRPSFKMLVSYKPPKIAKTILIEHTGPSTLLKEIVKNVIHISLEIYGSKPSSRHRLSVLEHFFIFQLSNFC